LSGLRFCIVIADNHHIGCLARRVRGGQAMTDITATTITNLNKQLRKHHRKTIPLSEWLKKPALFGLPIIEDDKIKDHGEIKFGDLSEYIRRKE
jgi:hypothetical protein